MDRKAKRLKLSSEEIKEQNDSIINKFPSEVLEKIFSYLNIRQLCQARQVCKKWHTILQYPDFWKKIDVDFYARELNQKGKPIKKFADMLLPHVTHLKLTFDNYESWTLDLAEFLKILQPKCPDLRLLIFHRAALMVKDKCSVLNTVAKFLPNIDVLVFHDSILKCGQWLYDDDGHRNIDVLDISNCLQNDSKDFLFYSGSMPALKELHFAYENTYDLSDDPNILSNLEIVDIECNIECRSQFKALLKFGLSVTELYMCFTDIQDEDINFDNSVKGLRYLKMICLRGCIVTFESINLLIESCPFLQQIYVGGLCGNSNPIDYTMCDPKKVKVIYSSEKCKHYSKRGYWFDYWISEP